MPTTRITTHHLELRSPVQLVPPDRVHRPFSLRRLAADEGSLARRLYLDVGGPWQWIDRRPWSEADWTGHLAQGAIEIWLATADAGEDGPGRPAGYFELCAASDNNVEIAYFGLLGPFIGQGIGPALLTAAVNRAWAIGARRVWLHTCSLDHPRALSGYQARGFTIFDVVHADREAGVG